MIEVEEKESFFSLVDQIFINPSHFLSAPRFHPPLPPPTLPKNKKQGFKHGEA